MKAKQNWKFPSFNIPCSICAFSFKFWYSNVAAKTYYILHISSHIEQFCCHTSKYLTPDPDNEASVWTDD